jgi:hypothetical protein
MIYELRVYHCMPGKLPAVSDRFKNITSKIWERYGIKAVGYWTVMVGENSTDFIYMLSWKDLAERERVWNAFLADAEWKEKRAATEANGPIVASVSNSFLSPTDYSPLK